MLIGYARVSTDDQDTAAQVAALEAAGCERIFREKASGGRWERPQSLRLLNQLRSGDVVVVWKLDRLSRSLRDVLTIMEQLAEAGAGFRSLTETIDTTTPAGRRPSTRYESDNCPHRNVQRAPGTRRIRGHGQDRRCGSPHTAASSDQERSTDRHRRSQARAPVL